MAHPSIAGTALGNVHPLRAHELAHACGAELAWPR